MTKRPHVSCSRRGVGGQWRSWYVWLDRAGLLVSVPGVTVAWWRPGAWLPLTVRETIYATRKPGRPRRRVWRGWWGTVRVTWPDPFPIDWSGFGWTAEHVEWRPARVTCLDADGNPTGVSIAAAVGLPRVLPNTPTTPRRFR